MSFFKVILQKHEFDLNLKCFLMDSMLLRMPYQAYCDLAPACFQRSSCSFCLLPPVLLLLDSVAQTYLVISDLFSFVYTTTISSWNSPTLSSSVFPLWSFPSCSSKKSIGLYSSMYLLPNSIIVLVAVCL